MRQSSPSPASWSHPPNQAQGGHSWRIDPTSLTHRPPSRQRIGVRIMTGRPSLLGSPALDPRPAHSPNVPTPARRPASLAGARYSGARDPFRVPDKMREERQGFEPWVPCGTHDFQSCTFGHSVISPGFRVRGESGSRTHVGLAPKPDFESGAFGHSAISPDSAGDMSSTTAPLGR